ncbi:MAG TPA: hypothetical protein PK954_06340, partial [Anaerolineales bacterium]|nr:hypothetical protein [Anaerolineales bacterium]
PATDAKLAARFSAEAFDARKANKVELQRRLGLPERPNAPLLAMVTRLDWQKGVDIIGHPLNMLLNGGAGEAQAVIVGSGSAEAEAMLRGFQERHPDRMRAI